MRTSRMIVLSAGAWIGLGLVGCDPELVTVETHPDLRSAGASATISADDYRLIPLPLPAGVTNAAALKINDNGVIVGVTNWGGPDAVALRWDQSRRAELLVGMPQPTGINNRGDIVGGSKIFTRSGIRDLSPLPGGSDPRAAGINNRGDVVGTSRDVEGWVRPVMWRGGKRIEDLGTFPGYEEGSADAINERGDVIGWNRIESTGQRILVLWTASRGLIEIFYDPSGDVMPTVLGLNNRRQFAGVSSAEWTLGSEELGVINLSHTGALTGINGRGLIVGWSDEIGGSGAGLIDIREPRNIITLPVGYDPEEFCLWFAAQDINNRGDIVGDCHRERPFMWQRRDRSARIK